MLNRTSRRYSFDFWGHEFFLFDLLVIFSISLFIFSNNFNNNHRQLPEVYNNFEGASNESITLKIDISKANAFSGQLMINFQAPPKKVTNSLVILPLVVGNVKRDYGDIHVSTDIEGNYSILNIITSSTTTYSSQVSFQIIPKVIDANLFSSDLYQKNPDFFIVEKRSDTLYTLLFNFDTELNHNPFRTLGDLPKEMIVPSQIIVQFSTDITFTSIPEADPETYNIYDDLIHRGTYGDNAFTTPIQFYYDQPLKVNYILPPLLPPVADLIIFIVIALVTLIPTISSFFFDPEAALILCFIIAIVVLLAVIGTGIFVGFITLMGYFVDNYKLYFSDGLTYLLLVASFFYHFFKHRKSSSAPGTNPPTSGTNPPAPGTNPSTSRIRPIILQKVLLANWTV